MKSRPLWGVLFRFQLTAMELFSKGVCGSNHTPLSISLFYLPHNNIKLTNRVTIQKQVIGILQNGMQLSTPTCTMFSLFIVKHIYTSFYGLLIIQS